ncbi:MAG: RNA polymerase factor sigma-54 [Spirochaetes bacterium]|nr:RNA polymerase factor sigma-54 [Spirochaetota bacterium]
MAIGLQTSLKQTQKLAMTQNLKQSLEMLQMNSLELTQLIRNELETNPVLEESDSLLSDKNDELIYSLSMGIDSVSPMQGEDEVYSADEDRKQQYIENLTSHKLSLYEHFVEQIRELDLDKKELIFLEKIAGFTDSDGFLTVSAESIISDSGIDSKRCNKLFDMFHRLEPQGCGCSGIQETLLVQSKIHFPDEQKLHEMIGRHFELLKNLSWDKLSKELCVSIPEIKQLSGLLSKLEPYPGRSYSAALAERVFPEAKVALVEDEVIIQYYDGNIPDIKINSYYINVLRKKNIDKNIRKFIKDGLDSAKGLLKNIFDRRVTFEKVLRSVMNHQKDFLRTGTTLNPLTYQVISSETDFHESTVSRAVSGKYIETEWGIYPLKHFFSNRNFGGENSSSDEIKKLLNDIVSNENPESPISDEDISRILSKSGYDVARRTVAKYRTILGIPSSSKRKRINLIK